jgi:hypothetical protein
VRTARWDGVCCGWRGAQRGAVCRADASRKCVVCCDAVSCVACWRAARTFRKKLMKKCKLVYNKGSHVVKKLETHTFGDNEQHIDAKRKAM